jgi:hypothetical protein
MAKKGKPRFKNIPIGQVKAATRKSRRLAKGQKKLAKVVVRLSSSKPEARDEGPRLLPLNKPESQPGHFGAMDHYLDLADKVLRSRLKNKDDKSEG